MNFKIKSKKATHYLIAGGPEIIGSHLIEALFEKGDQVTIIDNQSNGRFENISHLVDTPGFKFAIDTITYEVVM